MGRKSEPLKVKIFLSLDGKDGHYKPWEECTPEEIARFQKGVNKKVSECLSRYYSNHPVEFEQLVEKSLKQKTQAV